MAEDDDIEIFAILLGQFPHAALGVFHVRREQGGRKLKLAAAVVECVACDEYTLFPVKQRNMAGSVSWGVDHGETLRGFLPIDIQFVRQDWQCIELGKTLH